jgi:glycosyltransferase involved in cell wall biosynthesis
MIRISVVIPAFNEQDYLPSLLDSIEQARASYTGGRDTIEVIVANNQSTDATESIALERGCRVVSVDKRSIAAARNGGANIATGSVLCFVDADLVIHPQSFNAIDSAMSDGQICGGATGWQLERYSAGLRATATLMLCLTRLAGVNAGMVFCRANIFKEIGGYNENKKYAEDVEFFRAMRKFGKKKRLKTLLSTETPAIVSTRKFDKHGDWHMFRMFLWIPFRYGSYKKWIHAYWYDENERF